MVGVAALVCAIALTLVSAGLVYLSINQLHTAFGWVQHTDRTILQILNIEKSVLAADSAIRSDTYFGKGRNPVAAGTANAGIAVEVERLAWLTADNPVQRRHVSALRVMLQTRAAAGPVREETEFRRLAAIRNVLVMMHEVEFRLLGTRSASTESDTTASLLWAAVTGLLALLLGLLGIGLLTRERTYRGQVQKDLMHMQRLNTMGLATTALAHELNQPLTAAINYLAALKLRMAGGTPGEIAVLDILKRSQDQLVRAGKIIRRLRNYVEKPGADEERTVESPAVVIDDLIALLGTLDSSVRIVTRIDQKLPPILVDKVQLQQVVLNLIRNSIESDGWQGTLRAAAFGNRGRIRSHSVRCAGQRPRPHQESDRQHVQAFHLDQEKRLGRGPVDLPGHRRRPWRAHLGDIASRRRHRDQFHVARRAEDVTGGLSVAPPSRGA